MESQCIGGRGIYIYIYRGYRSNSSRQMRVEIRENSFVSIDSFSQLEIRRDTFIYTGFINQPWPSFEQQSCFMFYPARGLDRRLHIRGVVYVNWG